MSTPTTLNTPTPIPDDVTPLATGISCGVVNCEDPEQCFATSEGPKCGMKGNWRLNPMVFPPIEYRGRKIGKKEDDQCVLFDYSLWTNENINWLLTFIYQNWASDNYDNVNINNITLPSGSFVRPLDYIGSCNEVLPFELESSTKIFLQQLYCDNGLCKKKFSTTDEICYSSNQCLSQLCGDATAIQPIDGNTIFEGKTCIFDNFVAYDQLKGNRNLNVIIDNHQRKDHKNKSKSKSSDSMVFVVIILLIILLGLIICGYARRLFRKQEENSVDNYSRRAIDPETGEITTLGGRVRRGASILLNRGGSLNRSNSVRTLPPYSVVAEVHPATSNVMVTSISESFFPPGELPPPYDSVTGNGNANTGRDVTTLDEVREDANNDHPPKELSIISELSEHTPRQSNSESRQEGESSDAVTASLTENPT
ncbi:14643_t:CDS:2 [Funneliformis caledonium]|uniref:14643_t:CDS:1 n=1 Tax=Funneliformis caledonium TaxID=1117310 RepID=A0A9N9ET50_9GLOM|nr:14643_t:CDS:2 [Funneliformis caledonium]